MNDDILNLIEQGRQWVEEDRQSKEETMAKKIREAEQSWADYTEMLRKRLPLILVPYMKKLTAEGSSRLENAPVKINGYEYVLVEIPELAPILVQIHTGEKLFFRLPGIVEFDKPKFMFGSYASGYYNENQLEIVLYEALQLIKEFDEAMSRYEAQYAELADGNAEKIANPEYVPVEGRHAVPSDQTLRDALKALVREVVSEVTQ
jgi:hypothetical protein